MEADTTHYIDVLVTGSSHAYRGFDPRIFAQHGLRLFNLGSSSQTPIQTEYLIERYLEQFDPQMVIMEVYPKTFVNDGIESSIDIIPKVAADLDLVAMTSRINKPEVYNLVAYNYFNQLVGSEHGETESIIKKKDTYVAGGYVEKELSTFQYVSDYTSAPINMKSQQLMAFERVVSLLKSKGIRVILVQAPVTQPWYESFENMPEITDYFQGIEGTEYYDFNTLMQLDDKLHFYDHHHLNQDGVELFNEKLIEVVEL